MRLLPVVLLVGTMLTLLLAPAAEGATARRWPGRTITYFDGTKDPLAVKRSVAAWNTTGIGIRFVRTFSRSRAQLLIRNTRQVPSGCGTGLATFGYPGRGRQAFVNILHGTDADGQACSVYGQTLVLTHELGHVLGLDHETRRCSLMNTSHTNGVAPTLCYGGSDNENVVARRATWRCRVIEPIDRLRARRIYGGRLRPVRPEPWCDLAPRIAAPLPMTATHDPVQGEVSITLRRPATPARPAFLPAIQSEVAEIYRSTAGCLTTRPVFGSSQFLETAVDFVTWSQVGVAAGADHVVSDRPETSGRVCYSAFARDELQRFAIAVATAEVDVPAEVARRRGARTPGTRIQPAPGAQRPSVVRFD